MRSSYSYRDHAINTINDMNKFTQYLTALVLTVLGLCFTGECQLTSEELEAIMRMDADLDQLTRDNATLAAERVQCRDDVDNLLQVIESMERNDQLLEAALVKSDSAVTVLEVGNKKLSGAVRRQRTMTKVVGSLVPIAFILGLAVRLDLF
jgi:cell division protein FtsB